MTRLFAVLALAGFASVASAADKNVPPLWQGTPYVSAQVIFGSGCSSFHAVPEGMVLFVVRATVNFNVAPGGGANAAVKLTPLGAALPDFLYVPTFRSGPVDQQFGVYDGYMGAVDIGLPAAGTPEACFFASNDDDVRGRIIVTGYLVPATP